jgi:hypothetical protein
MFILLPVFDSVARGEITIAIDIKSIQAIKPASEDPSMCLVHMGEKVWRVNSSFEKLVNKINNALKGEKDE